MTQMEQTILRELATLPEARLTDVLAFVRFLKISLPDAEPDEREYDAALAEARATALRYNITEEEIAAEIRAVREGQP